MAKTTAQYLTSIVNSKEAIRQSIVAKGQTCDKDVPLSQYAEKIMAITSGTEIVVQSNADFYQCVFCADGVWSGYKAVLENGRYRFETTITEGLKYTSVKPEVGKIYTVDALAQIAYLYDIGGTGGQCPNLSDCVTIVCPACDEKFCKTHETHECEDDGGDNNKKCPNLPECKPMTCSTCEKSYCSTHDQHVCKSEGDGGIEDGDDSTTKPENCPYGEGCVADMCTVCNTTYCKTHDEHGCVPNECPNLPECLDTVCGCGAKFCSTHQSHPADICCIASPKCLYQVCDTCQTQYCTVHSSHTSAQCCPNSSNCHVEECESRDCAKTYCTRHSGFEHPCPLCGGEFCSAGCYIDHGCANLQQCNAEGCGNNAYDDCSKCGKRFCIYHLTDHECKTGNMCWVSGCSKGGVACKAVGCDHLVCEDHWTLCKACNPEEYYCSEHINNHGCSGTLCAKCNEERGTNECEICSLTVCSSCGSTCDKCGKFYCRTCLDDALHTCGKEPEVHCHIASCTAEEIQKCAAGCGKWTCNGHGYVCLCGNLFCPECGVNHDCEADGGCEVGGCSEPVSVACSDCGKLVCSKHSDICNICTNAVCLTCRESHTHETDTTCEVDGCTEAAHGVACSVCGKQHCVAHCHECQDCDACFCSGECEVQHNCTSGCEVSGCTNAAVGLCAQCTKQLCSDHRMVCETCDAPPLCPDCWSPHNHETASKCCVEGCTATGDQWATCVCGRVYCPEHWMDDTSHCYECKTKLCEKCIGSHECATAKCGFGACGTTENLNWVCPECGTLVCDRCTEYGMFRSCPKTGCFGDLVQR